MVKNSLKSKTKNQYVAFFIFLYFFVHQSFYSFYLGSNWDEQNVIKSSGRYIEKYMFLLRGNKPADAPYVAGEFYGEVIKLPIHLLTRFENINLVFMQNINKLFDGLISNVIDAQFVLRHIFFNLYTIICLIYIYKKLKKLTNENVSLLFLVFLVFLPSFIGQAIFNPTDTPFALHIFIATLVFFDKLIYNNHPKNLDLFIVSFWVGVSLLTRVNALAFLGFLSIYLLFKTLKEFNLKEYIYKNLVIYFGALFIWIIFTPGVILYPIEWLEQIIWHQFSQDWQGDILVNGIKYYSLDSSLFYIIKIFFFKLPVVHIIFLIYGASLFFTKKISSPLINYSFYFVLYFLIVFSIYTPTILDYLRHYQFLLPFIALISSYALNTLSEKINIFYLTGTVLIYLIFTQFSLGAYKYIYLNEFVDESKITSECQEIIDYNGCGLWQTDYYGLSGKEMVQNIESLNIDNIYFCDPTHTYTYYISDELNWKNNNGIPDFDDYSYWGQYKYIYNADHLNEFIAQGGTEFFMTAPHRPYASSCGLNKVSNIENNLSCKITDTVETKLRSEPVVLNYLYSCTLNFNT